MISVGTPGTIIGNPPYEGNEAIIYTCATNFALYGTAENICNGPPHYNWTLERFALPSCLQSKNEFFFDVKVGNSFL